MQGGSVVFLRAETLVDALAVFMAFWKQHGLFEDRAHYLLHRLTQDMRTMCAQYARQRVGQICAMCRKKLEFKNAKIVSNFLFRPVPFRPRRNVRKRGSLQSDVCARWVVSSHRCHCQGVVAVHCPGSRHELASLPCRPYMHFQRTHM